MTDASVGAGAKCKLIMSVDGMTCASCVRTVERELKGTKGVVEASVNLL